MPLAYFSDPGWQSCQDNPDGIPERLREWLLDRGSLTLKLRSRFQQLSVQVQTHQWAQASEAEQRFLGISEPRASIREVFLLGDGLPRVFARTVIPKSSATGSNSTLLTLGNTPLGEFLFAQDGLRRGAIEWAALPAQAFVALLKQQPEEENVWARRSLFYLDSHPLSVCEVFLPDFFA